MWWRKLVGPFKKVARGPTNVLFFFHIISLLLIYQKSLMAQLANADCVDIQDLGSSPRSVLFFILFFNPGSHAVPLTEGYDALPNQV